MTPLSHRLAQTLLLVDDHNLFRTGLSLILKQHPEFDFHILEAASAAQALERARETTSLDLVLMDINMPGGSGLDAMRNLRPLCPKARLAILSAMPEANAELRAMEAGADGYISKTANTQDIQRAVAVLLQGGRYFSAQAVQAYGGAPVALSYPTGSLTPRQLETLALMAEGCSNKVIARKMNLSENTVRVHVAAVIDHFQCSTRLEAVVAARRLGMLDHY